MNYSASFLNFTKKRIVDNFGNPIESINYTDEVYPYKYQFPKIVYNLFEDGEENLTPVIREIRDIEKLKEIGFALCSYDISKKDTWFNNQRSVLQLQKIGSIEEKSARKIKHFKGPGKDNYYAIYDSANNRIKLIGRRAGPNGEGPWLTV